MAAALDDRRYGAELEAETGLIADLARDADPSLPVPGCPEWTLGDLIAHLGRGHRWAAAIVSRRSTEYVPIDSLPGAQPPEDPVARSEWLRESAAEVVAAVREVGPDTAVWTLWLEVGRAGFWLRRRLHEALVHRADVSFALGRDFTAGAEPAADGVSELLELLASRGAAERRPETWGRLAGEGETLHFHATDEGLGEAGEWFVRRTPSGITWEHGHAKGDVAMRGAAGTLLLALYRRVPPDDPGLDVLGNRALLDHWLAHTAF